MKFTVSILTSLLIVPLLSQGQQPEFALDQLYPTTKSRQIEPQSEIEASCQLYSDGDQLNLVVEVIDPDVQLARLDEQTDHIEIWLALPKAAYPPNFEYEFHPQYVFAPGMPTRGDDETIPMPRFFSMYSEYGNGLQSLQFHQDLDYPDIDQIRDFDLNVPVPNQLSIRDIPFGIVHFGLFPDNRPPVHYNRSDMEPIERALEQSMGDLAEGIRYYAEAREAGDGYIIHASISPKAFGFVQLPRMSEFRFMLEVHKQSNNDPSTRARLSSSQYREPGRPSSFNHIRLQRAVNTNFTPVPADVFDRIDFHPLCMYGDDTWKTHDVDVDALVYREQETSKALTEIKFLPRPFRYESYYIGENTVEQFTLHHHYVNRLSQQREYFIVNNHLLESVHGLRPFSHEENYKNSLFLFPDGKPGLIIRNNFTLDPYGWGPCGDCIQEEIQIYRIETEGPVQILSIRQGEGPNAYCEVGDLFYEQFYLSHIDWIHEGEVMVLRLNDWASQQKRRVKIRFNDNGKSATISEVRP